MAVIFNWWVTELLTVLATVLLILYVTFRINFGYWKRKGLPYLEPSFPFGNTWYSPLMRKSSGEEMVDIYKKASDKDVVGIFSLNVPILVVRDPELIKTVLVKDFNYFPDRGIQIDLEQDPIIGNLFFISGNRWRILRNKLSPTFTSGKMKAMFTIVRDCASTLAEVMPVGDDVEMREIIARYSTDTIASCAFGIDVDSQHNPEAEFRQWGRRFFEPSLRSFVTLVAAINSPLLRKLLPFPLVPKDIAEYFTRVVKDTVEYRERSGVARKDFMQLLIQLKNDGVVDDSFSSSAKNGVEKQNRTLTTKELAAQAWGFFVGGFETSSTTTSFCLYELSRHQDVQKRLQDEIADVLKKNGGEITYEDVTSGMPYLEKVVCETLRKYPPAHVLNREVEKDYKLERYDCVLEKGTKIVIPVWGLHLDPKHYQNPDAFDPEHFSEEQKATRHPYCYLPFGEGPRICIGMRFGQMQVKLALVSLLSQFRFLPKGDLASPLRFDPTSVVPASVDGIRLRVERRLSTA